MVFLRSSLITWPQLDRKVRRQWCSERRDCGDQNNKKETESKIKWLEEELEEDSEDDAENDDNFTWPNNHEKLYLCHYCDVQIRAKSNFNAHIKSHMQKESKEHINKLF